MRTHTCQLHEFLTKYNTFTFDEFIVVISLKVGKIGRSCSYVLPLFCFVIMYMKQLKMECPFNEVSNANLILIHTSTVTASHKGMNEMGSCISLTAQVTRNYFE